MKIAILGGTGKEGSGLGFRWAAKGHEVLIGSRSAERAEAAAAEMQAELPEATISGGDNAAVSEAADVVVLSVPYSAQEKTLEAVKTAVLWWEQLTAAGGEGMVVKPLDFVVRGQRGIIQPAIKCRGREYLRIIYGPEYDAPTQLPVLKRRSLNRKRSLALREFALGVGALERFVRREPLRRVHECVFGVLAMESEPVDPRL